MWAKKWQMSTPRLAPRVGVNPRKRDRRLALHEPALPATWCATRPVRLALLALCVLATLTLLLGVPYLLVKVAQLPWH